ncbi:MAG: hypothetical protein M0009_16835 [Deltaproteobacteria bacterium]|nr:hypothetical protein [Deltaproteobacteria bacterium]
MVTAFNKYKAQRDKAAAKEGQAAVPMRKRTKAEAIANSIAMMAEKIDDLEFPDFTAEDRTLLIDAMNAFKEILDPAITRAVKNKKKPV